MLIPQNQKGMLTLDSLMALGIFASLVIGVLALVFLNQAMATDSENGIQALYLAAGKLEEGKAALQENFYGSINTQSSAGVFYLDLKVENLTSWHKKITSSASWNSNSKLFAAELSTVVSDLENMQAADTCGLSFEGSFENPVLVSSAIDLGLGNIATDIEVKNGLAYITADSATQSAKDLYIVDVSDHSNIHVVSSLHTGPGLGTIKVVGDYAYAASLSTVGQLQIINISNPASPFLVYTFVTGSGEKGISLDYFQNKVYLGVEKSAFAEFYIVDVLNPLHPVLLGSFETNTAVNNISVYGNIAYLSTPSDKQVWVLDISDPGNIVQLSAFSPPGSSVLHGRGLYVKGNRVWFGRTGLTTTSDPQLYYLDAANPSQTPQVLGSKEIETSVRAIFERGGYVFLATNDEAKEFQVLKPSLNNQFNQALVVDLQSPAKDLTCDNGIVYIVLESNLPLRIIEPN